MKTIYYVTDMELTDNEYHEIFGTEQLLNFANERQLNYQDAIDEDYKIIPYNQITISKAIKILKENGYNVKEYKIK